MAYTMERHLFLASEIFKRLAPLWSSMPTQDFSTLKMNVIPSSTRWDSLIPKRPDAKKKIHIRSKISAYLNSSKLFFFFV